MSIRVFATWVDLDTARTNLATVKVFLTTTEVNLSKS